MKNPELVKCWVAAARESGNAVLALDLAYDKGSYNRIIASNSEQAAEMILVAALYAYGINHDPRGHSLKSLVMELAEHHEISAHDYDRLLDAARNLPLFAGYGRFADSGVEVDRDISAQAKKDMETIYGYVLEHVFMEDFGVSVRDLWVLTKPAKPETIPEDAEINVSSIVRGESVRNWCEYAKAYAKASFELDKRDDRNDFARSICCFCELSAEMELKAVLISHGITNYEGHNLETLINKVSELFWVEDKHIGYASVLNRYSGGNRYPDRLPYVDSSEIDTAIMCMRRIHNCAKRLIEAPEKHLKKLNTLKPHVSSKKVVFRVVTNKTNRLFSAEMKKPDNPENEDGGALSSETARILYGRQASELAAEMYESFRKDDSDIARICASTGLPEDVVSRVKDHLFVLEHDFPDGKHRFRPYYAIADSWKRLMSGTVRRHDILLLQHELLEMSLMDEGMSQRAAHETAGRYFDFEGQSRRYYEFIRSKDEAVPGKTVAKRKDTGRSSR